MQDLAGKKIVITSGPTFAPIDAVRSITNRSTGRLGSTIARALIQHGAEVHFLAGETSLTPSMLYGKDDLSALHERRFTTVDQLRDNLREYLQNRSFDAVLMAAAVLDYVPIGVVAGKKRSNEDEWTIRLKRGEKIIERIKEWAPHVFLVGFKLEANLSLDDLTGRARDLMQRSGAQLVVANRMEDIQSGTHVAYLIERDSSGQCIASPPLNGREAIGGALAAALAMRLM